MSVRPTTNDPTGKSTAPNLHTNPYWLRSIIIVFMNTPRRHHFVPAFYLQQWSEKNGRLIEYSKRYSKLVRRSVGPRRTGFEVDLYSLKDLPPDSTQHLETKFLNNADRIGSEALRRLLEPQNAPWTPAQRAAWSIFLICMEMRHPDSIAELKSAAGEIWDETEVEFKKRYCEIRKEGQPETYEDYLQQRDQYDDAWGRSVIIEYALHDSAIRKHIDAMRWFVFDTSGAEHSLLTSDRPILFWDLTRIDGFIAMPISPSKIFVAANGQHNIDYIRGKSLDELVFKNNKFVVERAKKFVWAKDTSTASFVEQYMST